MEFLMYYDLATFMGSEKEHTPSEIGASRSVPLLPPVSHG